MRTNKERQFVCTSVVVELRTAVQCGYKIITAYDIWQDNLTNYDRSASLGGLFAEYIVTVLKMKPEASGYHIQCVIDKQRCNYIT